jgi:hypothetical protein
MEKHNWFYLYSQNLKDQMRPTCPVVERIPIYQDDVIESILPKHRQDVNQLHDLAVGPLAFHLVNLTRHRTKVSI